MPASKAKVIWLGARAQPTQRYDQRHYRTHKLDCAYALSVEQRQLENSTAHGLKILAWPRVKAKHVPNDVPRCSFCGGGR